MIRAVPLVAFLLLAMPAAASTSDEPAVPAAEELPSEAGGTHVRVITPEGPVHVYRPRGYERRTAGVVVYVHGYYLHVDEAWDAHDLGAQFAASGRNALFIVPEAPAAAEETPPWTNLGRLLTSVLSGMHLRAPGGPLIVVGHSGAYRTIVPWLDEPALHNLILVDALYGNESDFRAWLDRKAANRLTLVVKGTAPWADPFVRALPYARTLPRIPKRAEQFSRAERAAKLLCLRSQYGHFELITEGNTLPVLLGRTPLPPLKRGSHPPRRRRGSP